MTCIIVIALGIQISVGQELAPLNVAPAQNRIAIFWSASITNYVLQSTTNLETAAWADATDVVPVTAVTAVNSGDKRFFRLIAPPPSGMTYIDAGSFIMGDSLDGDTNATPLNVSVSAFCMDKTLVTYGQWLSTFIWATNHGYSFDYKALGKSANHPAQAINWYDTVKWCNARSEQAGLKPAYYTNLDLTRPYRSGHFEPFVNWTASGYRLPTEAEWEKAARGGLSGHRFPWGDLIDESKANYEGATNEYSYDLGPNGFNAAFTNGSPYTSPVCYFAVNGYGLCDMAGNVNEWCWDWYYFQYAGGSNPRGPSSGSYRVIRGGSFVDTAYRLRCGHRSANDPTNLTSGIGFRCVISL